MEPMDPILTAPPIATGTPAPTPVALGERFGKYRLERALATGGMAELYLARQSGPGGFEKQVVIKRILPHLTSNPEFVHMFLDEARIAARLSHPNIVQVFDFGEAGGSYFLVMEYLAGEDLDTILATLRERGRTMPPIIVALIASAACEALQYAHLFVDEHGRPLKIVHRDVSPSNIFLTHQGLVKVLDFGIAKAEGKLVHTQGGVLKGKFLYMSPEQIRGQEVDGRSDVFALGAVLHELLTGRPTFERDNALASLKAIVDEPIPRPSELVQGIPMDLEAVVLRAIEREPRLRWPSASDMRLALDRFIAKSASVPSSARLQDFLRELVGDQGALARANRSAPAGVSWASDGGTYLHQSSRSVRSAPSVPAPRPAKASGGAKMSELATLPADALTSVVTESDSVPRPLSESPTLSGAISAEPMLTPPREPPSSTGNQGSADDLAAAADDLAAVTGPRARPWMLVAGGVFLAVTIVLAWSTSRPAEPQPEPEPAAPAAPPAPAPLLTPSLEAVQPVPPTPALPPRRSAVPTPAASTGTLDVNCLPWCRVYIDGRDTKLDSPAKGIVLPVGLHRLRLVNPPSGVAREVLVEVSAGATVRRVIRF